MSRRPEKSGVLIISDFHLGPGKHTGEFEHFDDDDIFCEFLDSYRSSPEFQQLELIIAGDFFDSVQVKVDGCLPDRVYEHHALAKIKRIVVGHPKIFDAMSRFARTPNRSLTFLIGNHDPATVFSKVQAYLRTILGDNVQFEIQAVSRPPLLVKHGNEWDAVNNFEGETIISEDLDGPYIRFPWGTHLVIDFVNRIRARVPDIDKIKPLGAFIRWASLHRPRDALYAFFIFFQFALRHQFNRKTDQRMSLNRFRKILRGTCYSCALTRQISKFMRTQNSCILVAGHTHRAMQHSFSDQHIYVNTGTWNSILEFHNGAFTSIQHRTYALYHPNVDKLNKDIIELLQWIPGNGPSHFKSAPFNIHMHRMPSAQAQ